MEDKDGYSPSSQLYQSRILILNYKSEIMEPDEGVKPSSDAYKATVLSLN